MIILGIDTAIRCTGYGVINMETINTVKILDCGVIKNSAKLSHSECLRRIAGGIRELINAFHPDTVSIEDAFCSKNIKTAMILSMARGVAICAAAEAGLQIYAYSPKSAKRAMTGSGDATKERIAAIAAMMFGINIKDIPLDSTDALAIAMCHAQIAMKPELKHLLSKPI